LVLYSNQEYTQDIYFLHTVTYTSSNNLINEKLFLDGLLTVCIMAYWIF